MSKPSPENGRPKTIFTHNKFKLKAKPLPDAKRNSYNQQPQEPTFEIVPVNNEWHFKVYTNSQSDTKANGIITAAMDAPTLYAVFASLSKVAQSVLDSAIAGTETKGMDAMVMDNRGYSFQGGKRSDSPHTLSTTHIGIDDGGIYISVRSKGRPDVNFYVNSNEFHTANLRVNGQKHSGGLLETAIYSLGMATAYMNIATTINKDHFISWQEIKAAKEANRQNGGNRNQGNRGGYSGNNNYQQGGQQGGFSGGGNAGSASLFDDDIPM